MSPELLQTMAIIHCAHPQCSQFNRNSKLPCHAFFDLKPQDVEVLNNLLNSKDPIPRMQKLKGDLSYGEEECWTRTDNNGNPYVTCDGSSGGGSSGKRSINQNPSGKGDPKITFDPPSKEGVSIDQKIKPALASTVEKVAKDLKVDLRISSTTGGHTSGNHPDGKAVDIARINDIPVSKDSGKILDDVMQSFRNLPDVYQVFGPRNSRYEVDGEWYDDEHKSEPTLDKSKYNSGHKNHIHVGMR